MQFTSPIFALFLPLMLAVYWQLRGDARRWALLVGSCVFYGWWDWRFLGLLGLSTVVDYCVALAIDRRRGTPAARSILCVSVVVNLGILAAFKYFNFFRDSAQAALAAMGFDVALPTLDVLLPAGISFYTFQTMSYTIDVYRGERPERSLRDFALFVSCFPQLVAGPIVRAAELIPQLQRKTRWSEIDLPRGVYRLFVGLFKKMVVADTLALYVDAVFSDPTGYHGVSSWIAVYAYAFQIYMDFSGYCDVAVGVGELLGLHFPENFNLPYLAASPSEFWRRWHITLSTWLRDYLYIPLGGSRWGFARTVRNLLITMLLGGLWHGASWMFIAWGAYHGLLLVAEKLVGRWTAAVSPPGSSDALRWVRVAAMFHATCLGWLLFRSPDASTALVMLGGLFDFSAGDVRGLRILLIVAVCWLAHLHPHWREWPARFARLPAMGQGALAAVGMWTILLLSPHGKPFIYFQF